MIYIDANIFYNYLFDSEFADEAEEILSLSGKVTSKIAINEAVYVSIRKLARDRYGITNVYKLKSFVRTSEGKKILEESYSMVLRLLDSAEIKLVEEEDDMNVVGRVAEFYALLPNDAMIVATCMKHRITRIATFDRDFEGVPFLEIVRGGSEKLMEEKGKS